MTSIKSLIFVLTSLASTSTLAQIIDFRPQPGPIGHNDFLSSRSLGCRGQLCTELLEWRTTGFRGAVVTVESPTLSHEEGQVKLFACSGTSGRQEASWIKPGHEYIFRLYESDHCTRDVAYYDTQIDQLTVVGSGGNNPGPGPGPGGSFGNIYGYRNHCYSDLCEYSISWGTNWGSSDTVVTVQIPGETQEKLMACEGSQGTARAPWIAPGKTYIFRVYEAYNMCTADVGRYMRPSSQLVVYERGARR